MAFYAVVTEKWWFGQEAGHGRVQAQNSCCSGGRKGSPVVASKGLPDTCRRKWLETRLGIGNSDAAAAMASLSNPERAGSDGLSLLEMVAAGIVDALSKLNDFLEMNKVQHGSDSPGSNEAKDDEDDDGNVSDEAPTTPKNTTEAMLQRPEAGRHARRLGDVRIEHTDTAADGGIAYDLQLRRTQCAPRTVEIS
ncbi:hypothetical protein AAL_05356 [Moelleriella libera RCEF 2490]|uniref:Uncharacterized protein n=1 Tax=Moelleriella libera RCEF 2490 TaxID=1081109 RepID=A0A168AUW5_9HYPO|nr:hypothetical protein AAL_05356 [Moelleriella libera RCEF 2490]